MESELLPMKTTYKVTAVTGYAGHKQGDEFQADLTEAEEKRAVERGSIKPVHHKEVKKEAKADE